MLNRYSSKRQTPQLGDQALRLGHSSAQKIAQKLALALGLWALLAGFGVRAQEPLWEQHLVPNDLVPNQLAPSNANNLSVERAIRIVRRETGGRVLAAAAGERQGRPGVNVRTLLDGERVTTFFVHADGRLQKR